MEKRAHPLLGIAGIGRTVSGFVVGVLEGVTGVRVDLHVHGFALGVHGGGELVHVLGCNPMIERAKVAENGGVNPPESGGVGRERTVIDGHGAQVGIRDGELGRKASTHAPADRPDAVRVDGFEGLEVVGGGDEVADAAILREPAHELMGSLRVGGGLAPVKIDGEGDVSLGSEIGGLLLDPGNQAPPFMDRDDGGMRSGSGGGIEKGVDGLASAWEGDLRRLRGGENRGCKENDNEGEQNGRTLDVHLRSVVPAAAGCQVSAPVL